MVVNPIVSTKTGTADNLQVGPSDVIPAASQRCCRFVSTASGSSRCLNPPVGLASSQNKDGFCATHLRLAIYLRKRTAFIKRCHRKPIFPLARLQGLVSSFFGQSSAGENDSFTQEKWARFFDQDESSDEVDVDPENFSYFPDDYHAEEMNEPLKHAGIYTVEEVVRINLEKMVKLRELYVDQMDLLRRRYHYQRTSYLNIVKSEKSYERNTKSTGGTLDAKMDRKLKALRNYRRIRGVDRILKRKSKLIHTEEKKLESLQKDDTEKMLSCDFGSTSGEKCSKERLPGTTFCLSHIGQDSNQILFSKCSNETCTSVALPPK